MFNILKNIFQIQEERNYTKNKYNETRKQKRQKYNSEFSEYVTLTENYIYFPRKTIESYNLNSYKAITPIVGDYPNIILVLSKRKGGLKMSKHKNGSRQISVKSIYNSLIINYRVNPENFFGRYEVDCGTLNGHLTLSFDLTEKMI